MYATTAKLWEMRYITRCFSLIYVGGIYSCHHGMASASFITHLSHHIHTFVPKPMLREHGVVRQCWDLSGYNGNGHQNGRRSRLCLRNLCQLYRGVFACIVWDLAYLSTTSISNATMLTLSSPLIKAQKGKFVMHLLRSMVFCHTF